MRKKMVRLSEKEHSKLKKVHKKIWGEASEYVPMGETIKKFLPELMEINKDDLLVRDSEEEE